MREGAHVSTASGSDRINTQPDWLIPSLSLRVLTRPPLWSGYYRLISRSATTGT